MPGIIIIAVLLLFAAFSKTKAAASLSPAAKAGNSTIPAGKGNTGGASGPATTSKSEGGAATTRTVLQSGGKGGSGINFGGKVTDTFPAGEKASENPADYAPSTDSGVDPSADAGDVGESDLNTPSFADVGTADNFGDPGSFGGNDGFAVDQSYIDSTSTDFGSGFGDVGGGEDFGDQEDFGD